MAMYVIFSNAKQLKIEHDTQEKNYCIQNNCEVIKRYYSNSPKVEYKYTFKNGETKEFNVIQAKIYEMLAITKIESGGPLRYSTKDIYQGYNPAFGMYVDSRTQHKKELKERGLIEMGNEDPRKVVDKQKPTEFISDNDLRDIVGNMGAEISGNEAEALKKGVKLHKDIEVKEDTSSIDKIISKPFIDNK